MAIDVDRAATDPEELARALRMPHSQVGTALGSHTFRATSTVDVTPADSGAASNEAAAAAATGTRLEVQARIDYGADDRFHAVVENSQDHGREVFYADGDLYLRPRYSKFHRRAPNDEAEPARIRNDIFAELSGYFDLVAPAVAVADQGPTAHAGRPGRRIAVLMDRGEQPRALPTAPTGTKAWRATAVVEEVSGEVVLDRDTGVALAADLRGVVRATRDGQPLHMRLTVTHRLEGIGEPVALVLPTADQWVPTPLRSREAEEREQLLDGLAQPARRAPTPANPRGNPARRGGDQAATSTPTSPSGNQGGR